KPQEGEIPGPRRTHSNLGISPRRGCRYIRRPQPRANRPGLSNLAPLGLNRRLRRHPGLFLHSLFLPTVLLLVPASVPAAETMPALLVEPAAIELIGHRSSQQLLVSAPFPDGTLADITRDVTYESLVPAIALVTPEGRVIPRGHGTGEIIVRHEG